MIYTAWYEHEITGRTLIGWSVSRRGAITDAEYFLPYGYEYSELTIKCHENIVSGEALGLDSVELEELIKQRG